MENSQKSFLDLVDTATTGELQLPAFQRDWKWNTSQVLELYDSLRKGFPIGSFLLIKVTDVVNLGPRPFKYTQSLPEEEPDLLVLDGQQRITAGIMLLHGAGEKATRFFINLERVSEEFTRLNISYENDANVKTFAHDLDDGDNYLAKSRAQTPRETMLLEKHLLCIQLLRADEDAELTRMLQKYTEKYPDRQDLVDFVIKPYFKIPEGTTCPVVTLDKKESLTAVTRIFSTLNTTGKKLTPVEIVTAILYASGIDLKNRVNQYHEMSPYLSQMDPDGVVMLQTVALLSNQSPKKSLLPKTVTSTNFEQHVENALSLLDAVGSFLSTHLGVGLDITSSLLPYDSILAPMAKVLNDINWHNIPESKRGHANSSLEKWFVCSALDQRYQEGVHNKQSNDAQDFAKWINSGKDNEEPAWTKTVGIKPNLTVQSRTGAIGKLLRCLINHNRPTDPLDGSPIGYYEGAHALHDHHIWPKKWCVENISDWDSDPTSADVALNIMPVSVETNKKWGTDNPKDQVEKVENGNYASDTEASYEKLFVTPECLEIMKRTHKSKKDYLEFLDARKTAFAAKMARWNIKVLSTADESDLD